MSLEDVVMTFFIFLQMRHYLQQGMSSGFLEILGAVMTKTALLSDTSLQHVMDCVTGVVLSCISIFVKRSYK